MRVIIPDTSHLLKPKHDLCFYYLVTLLILVISLSGCTEKPKTYKIGILSGLDFVADITDGFKSKMTELGYIEGRNIIYDVQKTDFDLIVYKGILRKFIADKVDVILAFPTEASLEAKVETAGTNIPVVFNFALVEGTGLVNSIRTPGGNVTGVRHPTPDIVLKRFEVMRELGPRIKRVLIPYQRGYPTIELQMNVLRPVAAGMGITLIELPAVSTADIGEYLLKRGRFRDTGIDAILFLAEPLAVTADAFLLLVKFAYEHRILIGGAIMSAGGYDSVFGVSVNNIATGEQAAPLVDKILKGTPAGTIPVVSADIYLQINYRAAQKIGITVPAGLLRQADEVIR